MRTTWFVVLGLWIGTIGCDAQEIRAITITSAWGGLGTPSKSHLTLHPSGDTFRGGGVNVTTDAIQTILKAIQEPVIAKPSAANLRIDEAWLRTHAEVAGKNASGLWFDEGTPAQKQFFRAEFTDVSTLQARLDTVYAGFHTDDYPSMSIAIEFTDGTSLEARSHSQNPLMLPWCVSVGSKSKNTYNAHISQRLFAILPKSFTDRERLHDVNGFDDLAQQMGLYMSGDLKQAWNMIRVRDKDPGTLRQLRENFIVRYADINTWNDLAFNEVPNTGKTVDENLQVILWHQGFPKNLTVEAELLRKDGITQGVDELPTKADQFANLVLSVRWLREFLEAHPHENAILNYVHGVSLTDKALRIFSSDMKATGHSELIERVKSVQSDAALLETGSGDWWIVLPDQSMILWRWESLRPILKWPMNTFSAKRCTDYATVSGGCDGTTISPEGDIVH